MGVNIGAIFYIINAILAFYLYHVTAIAAGKLADKPNIIIMLMDDVSLTIIFEAKKYNKWLSCN